MREENLHDRFFWDPAVHKSNSRHFQLTECHDIPVTCFGVPEGGVHIFLGDLHGRTCTIPLGRSGRTNCSAGMLGAQGAEGRGGRGGGYLIASQLVFMKAQARSIACRLPARVPKT